jgi:hypothetical protein
MGTRKAYTCWRHRGIRLAERIDFEFWHSPRYGWMKSGSEAGRLRFGALLISAVQTA